MKPSVDSDRPLPGDTTRCLYFTGTGGVLHREHPPFYWCLCFVLFSPTTNRQPPTQTNEFVINSFAVGLFFPGFFFCGERTVLRRFLRFSRVLSLESSLSAHSCRLITRKSTTSRLGRSFDRTIYSSSVTALLSVARCLRGACNNRAVSQDGPVMASVADSGYVARAIPT